MQKKKSILISFFALVLAACLALGLFLSIPKKAEAVVVSPIADNTVPDLVEENSSAFIEDNLNELYKRLAGRNGATLEDVTNLVQGTATPALSPNVQSGLPTALNVGNLVTNNAAVTSNQNGEYFVIVAGKLFRPVYLTRSKTDDVILTLLSADPNNNARSNFSDDNYADSASPTDNAYIKDGNKYPVNMYGYSKVRVETLNNGGQYALSETTLSQKITPSTSNEWARFTLSATEGLHGGPIYKAGIADFIATPSELAFQETEAFSATNLSSWVNVANESYGTPYIKGTAPDFDWLVGNGTAQPWTSAEGYDDWKDDKVWLPSITEMGGAGNIDGGIFYLSKNQRPDAGDRVACWTRSGQHESDLPHGVWYFYGYAGNAYVLSFTSASSNMHIAPAIHLNLTKAAQNIAAPNPEEEGEDTYNGGKLTKIITGFEKYECEVEATSHENGAEYNELTGEFSATKAGEYTLKIKPKDGYVWKDGTKTEKTYTFTINPVNITVTFPSNSGDKSKFGKKMEYIYRSDETIYEMKFPDNTNTIIKLVEADRGDMEIKYIVRSHDEPGGCLGDTYNDNNKPDKDSGDWKKFEDNEALKIAANLLKGYCVYFKISAPNHNDYIDWFSVHMVSEVLTIDADATIPSKEYGEAPHTQEDLKALVVEKINTITDQSGKIVYQKGGMEGSTLDNNKFYFYFTSKDGDKEYHTTDDDGGTGKWPAGEYLLNIKYNENGDNAYISFKWQDGKQPKFTITPKKITELIWEGNSKWENADYKDTANAPEELEDEFCWVYDEEGGAKVKFKPRAKFKGVGEDEEYYVLVSGEADVKGTHTATADCKTEDGEDIKNYAFDDGLVKTKQFKIVTAKNSWTTTYSCTGWSVGSNPSSASVETKAVPKFGLASAVQYVYHKDTKDGDTIEGDIFKQSAMTVVVVYSLAADSAGNYGAIEGEFTFIISNCAHDSLDTAEYKESSGDQHYRICPTCEQRVYEKCEAKPELGYTAENHYSVCKYCNKKYNYSEGHSWSSNPEITPATCTEAGKKVTKCTECDYEKEEEGDPALGHEYKASWTWSADNIPTLTITCDHNCGEINEVFTAGSGGVTVQSATTKTATCDTNGETTYTAKYSYLNTEYTDTHTVIIAAKGHLGKHKVEAKAATCAEEGNNEYWHCDDCNKNYTTEECIIEMPESDITVAKTAHSFGTEWSSDGTNHYHECTVCHEHRDEAAHSVVQTAAVAATCTEDGATAGSSCPICNAVLIAPEVVPATGHVDMAHHEYKEAQATSAGNLEYWYCDDCNSYFLDDSGTLPTDKNSVIIPALGTTNNGNGGGEGSVNPPLGGDTGLSGSSSDFLEKNLWWIILLAAILIALIAVAIILSAIHSHRRDKMFMEMMARSQGGYQPMGGMQYADNQRPIFVLGQPNDGGQTLQLPSGLDEETLANAIALAMQKANAAKPEEPADDVDVDGFYDDVDNYDGNE